MCVKIAYLMIRRNLPNNNNDDVDWRVPEKLKIKKVLMKGDKSRKSNRRENFWSFAKRVFCLKRNLKPFLKDRKML